MALFTVPLFDGNNDVRQIWTKKANIVMSAEVGLQG